MLFFCCCFLISFFLLKYEPGNNKNAMCLFSGSVRGEDTQTLQHLTLGQRLPEGSVAILSRCNVTVFSEAVRLTDANPTCKIYIVGVSTLNICPT